MSFFRFPSYTIFLSLSNLTFLHAFSFPVTRDWFSLFPERFLAWSDLPGAEVFPSLSCRFSVLQCTCIELVLSRNSTTTCYMNILFVSSLKQCCEKCEMGLNLVEWSSGRQNQKVWGVLGKMVCVHITTTSHPKLLFSGPCLLSRQNWGLRNFHFHFYNNVPSPCIHGTEVLKRVTGSNVVCRL